MFLWVFGIFIIHWNIESMATPTSASTSNQRDYSNTIGMMCAHNQKSDGYFYTNIGEGQASDYAWSETFGADRKVIFYVQGYGEDMYPEGKSDKKLVSYARMAQGFLFDDQSMICLFDFKHKKRLGCIGATMDFWGTATNRVPFVAQILKELAAQMHAQKVISTFENFELIGFSLGSHIAGLTARLIKSELGHEVPRIFALEPAKTFMRNFPHELRRTDAKYIQAIYTSKVSKQDLDVHCKVFVNDGANQEGCEGKILIAKDFCNHNYLIELYDDIGVRNKTLIGYIDPDRNGENYTVSAVLVGHHFHDYSTGVYYANTDGSNQKKKWLG